MSGRNGDRSRYNRMRKQKILRRAISAAVFKTAPPAQKPNSLAAPKK